MRGLTQDQLAERARMARTDIVNLEAGKLNLGPARLARVAEALEVSVLELRPEAEPDARGLDLLALLEELAENQAQMLENQRKGTSALTAQLRAIQKSLESHGEGARNAPRRSRRAQ